MFRIRTTIMAMPLICLSLTLTAGSFTWKSEPGKGNVTAKADQLQLELQQASTSLAKSAPIPVKANENMALTFNYMAENLGEKSKLTVKLIWLDNEGKDIDLKRSQIGFPPLKKIWVFKSNAKTMKPVADNLSVPNNAANAELLFTLNLTERLRQPAKVTIANLKLAPGNVKTTGLDIPKSGPDDAGPISTAPNGFSFPKNLVPNGAAEDGKDRPTGWQVIGNNSQNSAEWAKGGAYSGKRCFKINDRAPYVNSWEKNKDNVFVNYGRPSGNYANAREEVSARWVSDPVPVEPGTPLQAAAFVWYANRRYNDRGNVAPVRVQFLDGNGKVIPYRDVWEDWLSNQDPFVVPGWTPIWTHPVVAPDNATKVRVALVMPHAFYSLDGGAVKKRPDARGFVLVDNIMLYKVPTDKTLFDKAGKRVILSAEAAVADAIAKKALPFVGTSLSHRPNSLKVNSQTNHPGGVILVSPEGKRQSDLSISIKNLIGDQRDLNVKYSILDCHGDKIHAGNANVKVPPYQEAQSQLALPDQLPLGPYTIAYAVQENNKTVDEGTTRFALIRRGSQSVAERSRMDYPFSLWNHKFRNVIGTPQEVAMGKLMETAGMGKTWFGCGGAIYLSRYMGIKDEAARHQQIKDRIAEAKEAIAAWRRYGITPMGHLECPNLLTPEQYPILEETVTMFVTALKDDIHFWRYGTESMHGGVKELDKATLDEKDLNCQGGRNYLLWGRRGTVRQYWAEYFRAYAAAKKADPDCMFGPQCASDIEGNVLNLFFKIGKPNQLDMFGMNTYIGAYAIWPANINQLTKNGVPKLPIFVSEFAAQANCEQTGPEHYKDELEASGKMVRYWTQVLHGFPTFFHLEQWGMILGNDKGSLTYLDRVRPQYVAYSVMTDSLGAGQFVKKFEMPGSVIYARKRSLQNTITGVMWSSGKESIVDLKVGCQEVTVRDIWGNQRVEKTTNGVISLKLTDLPQYILGCKVLEPAPMVKIVMDHATTDPNRPKISLVITNEKEAPVAGTLSVSPESPVTIMPKSYAISKLNPGETRTYYFDVMPLAPDRDQRLFLKATLLNKNDNRTYQAQSALNFHFAPKFNFAPNIDGDLKEWNPKLGLVINRPDQVTNRSCSTPWKGCDDLSGKVWFGWDKKNLYVAAAVNDDQFTPSEKPIHEFTKDSIEILFDFDRRLAGGSSYQMITLAKAAGVDQVKRYEGKLKIGKIDNARIKVKREGTKTFYEAAIPWRELHSSFSPDEAKSVSIAISLNDGDNGRRCMSWFSLVSDKTPSEFGDLIFTGPNDPKENLLGNGTFDRPDLAPSKDMKGWYIWNSRESETPVAKCYLTKEGALEGNSLCIERLSPKYNMSAGDWKIPVAPGEVYYFKAMGKVPLRALNIWLNITDQNGKKNLPPKWMKALTPATSVRYERALYLTASQLGDRTAYNPIEAILEIPDNAKTLNISFSYNWASGKAYVDNVELYRLK